MSEKLEGYQSTNESKVENTEAIDALVEKAASKLESAAELSPKDSEAKVEQARQKATEHAVSVEAGGKEKDTPKDPRIKFRRGPIDKKTREKSYKQTVSRIQGELPVASRTFSKIIHNKAVEATSEALANTVARPNAILAGAVAAFILTLLTYVVAKTLGYKLSGSETIVSFTVGWLIGLIYDYFRLLITGKKS